VDLECNCTDVQYKKMCGLEYFKILVFQFAPARSYVFVLTNKCCPHYFILGQS